MPMPRRIVEVTCQQCGKVFEVTPSRIKYVGAKYCGRVCSAAAHAGPTHPNWKGGEEAERERNRRPRKPLKTITLTCKFCGKTFEREPYVLKQGAGKYCSHACRQHDKTGPDHQNWRGGRKQHNGYTYVYVPHHPRGRKGYVLEHRYVVEQHIGRLLKRSEHVHHINEDKRDNRIENLQVIDVRSHAVLHAAMKRAH